MQAIHRQNTRYTHYVWGLLAVCLALAHLPKWGQGPVGAHPAADRAYDFRTPYLAAQLWLLGQDPYDDPALKALWHQQCTQHGLTSGVVPGTPLTDMLYPPWAVPLFALLSPFTFPVAQSIYLVISLLSLTGVALATEHFPDDVLADRWPTGWLWFSLTITLLAAKATVPALRVGQPLWLALGAAFGAIALSAKRPWLAGLLLGVAALKFTVALPFGALLVLTGRWRTLASAGLTVLTLTSVYVAVHPDGLAALPRYLAQSRIPDALLLQDGPGQLSYYMKSFTGLDAWVAYGAPVALPAVRLLLLLAWVGLFGYTGWALHRRAWAPLQAFVALAIGALLCLYHMFYDVLLLLPLVLWVLLHSRLRVRVVAVGLCLPVFLPLAAVLDALHLPTTLEWLHLYQPVALLLLLIWVLAHPLKKNRQGSA